ncbi:MAG TPA: DeoR/GlpR family DNA-binding transcription regulator [Anaerolineaceae bacterium]
MMEVRRQLYNVERQEEIRRFVEERQRVTISDICEQFVVSEATARRDLDALVEQNKIRRVHGGAIAISLPLPDLPVMQRSTEQVEEKRRIGIEAAKLVADGDTVFLGGGTTVLEVARNLVNRRNLTVITNSQHVINLLSEIREITLICLGGMLRHGEGSFIGHLAEQSLSELRADRVIIGIRSIDPERGLTNDHLPETMTDRAILQIGREVIIVADHTKCGGVSAALVAPVKAIHVLVTDRGTSPEFVKALENKGIRVCVV